MDTKDNPPPRRGPSRSADVPVPVEVAMFIEGHDKQVREWVATQLGTQQKWIKDELREIKTFNARIDQRIGVMAEASVEARTLAMAAQRQSDEVAGSVESLEERVSSLEDTIGNQSQQLREAIDYHPQFMDLEERIVTLEADMDQKFDKMETNFNSLEHHVDEKFAKVDEKFAFLEHHMQEKFARVDESFSRVDKRFVYLERHVDEKFAKVDERLAKIEQRFDKIESELDQLRAFMSAQQNILRCREHEEIKAIGVLVPGRGFVMPLEHPTFVRDFLKLASDEKVSTLTGLLAFYRTRGYEYWKDSDDPSDDIDLDCPSVLSSLEEAVRWCRGTAMRTLASHLGLNYDEIMRLHRARVARDASRRQSRAGKRRDVDPSSSGGRRNRSSKVQRRSEIPDTEEPSESTSGRGLPHRPVPRVAAQASTTQSESHHGMLQQGQGAAGGGKADAVSENEEPEVISGASSDEMA